MILLNAEKISKGYSNRQLLDGCSLAVGQGDKIGLIGVNGTGKSTLLKVMAGVDFPDSGTVTRSGGVRVAYLPQNPEFAPETTVLQQVMTGVAIDKARAREAKVVQQADEYQCKSILTQLGLSDYDQPIGQLSGGQKRRVALACALAAESEVLILDEPTNHIDSEMVDWLESYLKRYQGAILMVTHDRYFLERVVNRIVELDRGKLYSYPANYSQYLELKAQREEMALATERKRQSLYRKELAWIQRGARARSTKAQFRVDRFEELKKPGYVPDQSKLEVSALSSRLGKKIIEIEQISKSFDGKALVKDFSYNLLRGDRVGIIGPNGYGKTTLVRMICGLLEPVSGKICRNGRPVNARERLRSSFLVMQDVNYQLFSDSVRDEVLLGAANPERCDAVLQALGLDGLADRHPMSLSGGQKQRVVVAAAMLSDKPLILLDEPTSGLDLGSMQQVGQLLQEWKAQGKTLLVITHDEELAANWCDRVIRWDDTEGV
mgnify:CR=1 FL=1